MTCSRSLWKNQVVSRSWCRCNKAKRDGRWSIWDHNINRLVVQQRSNEDQRIDQGIAWWAIRTWEWSISKDIGKGAYNMIHVHITVNAAKEAKPGANLQQQGENAFTVHCVGGHQMQFVHKIIPLACSTWYTKRKWQNIPWRDDENEFLCFCGISIAICFWSSTDFQNGHTLPQ